MNGKHRNCLVWYCLFGVLYALGTLLLIVCAWYPTVYSADISVLLYTLLGPLEGTSSDVVKLVVQGIPPAWTGALLLYAALGFAVSEVRANKRLWAHLRRDGYPRRVMTYLRRAGALGCAGVFAISLYSVNRQFDIAGFLQSLAESTYLYETEYADPAEVAVTAPDRKRNLIHIYVESLESTYLSKEEGGRQKISMLPALTALAKENLYFSGPENLSGMRSLSGTNWTMASLLAQTAGIPFAFPVDGNAMDTQEHFAPRLTTLGDILQDAGYVQEFLCGSDASFGGRRKYFTQHGDYQIYDLWTAREQGVIPEDYYVWWGFEDYILFDIAKEEASRLAKEDAPFNLTLLTVDLHHTGGYYCEQCGIDYGGNTGDVVLCTDRQVTEFVRWCQEQPFYEDTVIIVTGDHPRMDTLLIGDAPESMRTMYNRFINAAASVEGHTDSRIFTALDIFPTTLSALGFDIEGGRLGLGVDLFSGQATLAERLGVEALNHELSKKSAFYLDRFYYAP